MIRSFLPLLHRVRRTLAGQEGVALLMVLFVVVALAALVVSLTETTQRHLHLTQYYKNRLQAQWTAQSGIQAAVAILQLDAQIQPGYDGSDSAWNCESTYYKENALLFLSVPLCGSSLIEPGLLPAVQDPSLEEPAARTRCPIIDENSKLSLSPLVNTAQASETTDEKTFDRLKFLLLYLLKERDVVRPANPSDPTGVMVTEETGPPAPISEDQARTLAGYLVDWIDTPNNASTDRNFDQAEEGCPEDGLPYAAKNGRMDSMEEIALVCGFRHMPRTVIDELGRNLTVFNLTTNVNTATRPVLYAFCTQILQADGGNDSEAIYLRLHPHDDEIPDSVITGSSFYQTILGDAGVSPDVITGLQTDTTFRSEYFRVGITGVVINTETGSVDANAGVAMVVQQGGGSSAPGTPSGGVPPTGTPSGGGLRLYYYRQG
jgi:hypothetical protein